MGNGRLKSIKNDSKFGGMNSLKTRVALIKIGNTWREGSLESRN